MRALLVDDNRADVNLVQLALRSIHSDIELHIADDGVKALEILRSQAAASPPVHPDFILLDLKLPRKTGLEVLFEIKSDPDLRRIPVVVLSSSRAALDIARAYDAQAAAYFVKPLSGFEGVLETIMAFLDAAQLPADSGLAHLRHRIAETDRRSATTEGLRTWPAEQGMAAIVDGASDPIISVTLDGTIVSWNRAAEALYGYTPPEAIGKSIRLVVPEEGAGDLQATLANIGHGERVRPFDTVRVDRDGRKINVSTMASPVRDARGNVAGASLISREVTVRTQEEEKLRIAVEHAPNAMVMVNPSGEMILVNAETERLFGYARSELIGRTIDMLVPERFRGSHPQHRAGFMARPERRAMGAGRDLFGLRKDGTEFPVEIGLRPIDTPYGTVVLSAIVDITARKSAEEVLAQQRRELARSNEELEQFAYVASHDLQEPLRTVASYTRLLASRYADRLDDDARTFIKFAQDGAVRMQSLIDALLTYSRVGTRAREPVPVGASAALSQAMVNLKASIQDARAEVACGTLPVVRADSTQLVELFQNLIGNAIKFRSALPPRIEVAARREGPEWIFSVADNGIGIDTQFFDRIFEVFQRLHAQSDYPGTGIGLAICKRIVERLGGRIWLESTPGTGTTFFFSLPAEIETTPARPD